MNPDSTPKNLIVGANSFLAKQIIHTIKDSKNIVGLYHQSTNNFCEGIKYLPISEMDTLKDVFETVYIVSAFVPPNNNQEFIPTLKKINEELTQKICKKFSSAHIVFTSSVSVYKFDSKTKNESSICEAETFYGISKKNAESIVLKHPSSSILRISSMLGVGMKLSTFIPAIIQTALKNKSIKLFGDGTRKQNYIDVDDVAKLCVRAAELKLNKILLAIGIQSYNNIEMANLIQELLPEISIELVGTDKSPSFYYNAESTYEMLNFRPEKKFETQF